MPIIPALRRMRQEDCEFEANLDYMVRLFQTKKEKPAPLEKNGK